MYRMNVARLANIPTSIIKKAKLKSDEMQKEMEEKQLLMHQTRLFRCIMQSSSSDVQQELSAFLL
jgi:DNA mismatch repair ATPase MutS